MAIARHLRHGRPGEDEAWSYSVLQRLAYLLVIFGLFPLVIWTGLAMSPAMASAFPSAVTVLGGQQPARTMHLFVAVLLLVSLLVHIAMVFLAGFRNRVRTMITALTAAAGVSGIAAAQKFAQRYELIPPMRAGCTVRGKH
jgi:thiosulfate reductase cytochrome b subunit